MLKQAYTHSHAQKPAFCIEWHLYNPLIDHFQGEAKYRLRHYHQETQFLNLQLLAHINFPAIGFTFLVAPLGRWCMLLVSFAWCLVFTITVTVRGASRG